MKNKKPIDVKREDALAIELLEGVPYHQKLVAAFKQATERGEHSPWQVGDKKYTFFYRAFLAGWKE